ncbi:MAG: Rrf2 family transcriptional regulator [Planctomycetota bacterium]
MLALTKKTGYALVAMGYLAQLGEGDVASARQIAGELEVPVAPLMNVLKELAAAGYIESVRGARGGYRLSCDPEAVSLADVIAALEGPVRLSECLVGHAGRDGECSQSLMARCQVGGPLHRVQRKLSDFLKRVSLAEIVNPTTSLPRWR